MCSKWSFVTDIFVRYDQKFTITELVITVVVITKFIKTEFVISEFVKTEFST